MNKDYSNVDKITEELKVISFGDAVLKYWFSSFNVIYGFVLGLFVTALFFFHTYLIKDFKTTQERLKRDKG